jgi:hypothetical protein
MEEKIMNCKSCGKEIVGSGLFCQSCGARVETDALPVSLHSQMVYGGTDTSTPLIPYDSKLPFIAGILVLGYLLSRLFGLILTILSMGIDVFLEVGIVSTMTIWLLPILLLLIMLALSVPKKKAGLLIIPLALDTLLRGYQVYQVFCVMQMSSIPGVKYQFAVSIIYCLLFIALTIAFCLFVFRRKNVTKIITALAFVAFGNATLFPLIYQLANNLASSDSNGSYIFMYFVAFLCLVIPIGKESAQSNLGGR